MRASASVRRRALAALAFVSLLLAAPAWAATYTWNVAGSGAWTTAANWTPARTTPAADDILQFSGVSTVVTGVPTQTIGQLLLSSSAQVTLQGAAVGTVLTIAGDAGTDLDVPALCGLDINVATNTTTILLGAGATGSIGGAMTFLAAAHKLNAADAGAITFNSGATFTQGAGCTGNVFTNAGTANAIVFASGSAFHQAAGANPFGLAAPSSKVVFQSGSLFRMDQNSAPSFSGRTYANFEVAVPSFSQSATGTGGTSIDRLTMTAGTLNLNLTGLNPVHIKGNVSVAAGATLTFSPASAGIVDFSGAGVQTVFAAGTFGNNVNALIRFSNPVNVLLFSPVTLNGAVQVTTGALLSTVATLHTPGSMTVDGTFRLNDGGFATGSAFVYGAASTLEFANVSGSYGVNAGHVYWPAVSGPPNVKVSGAGGVTMNTARTVTGTFETFSGVTNGGNLTLNGTAIIRPGGYFIGAPNYGSSSTLSYQTGGPYGRGDEWSATAGAGFPRNVTVGSGTTLDLGNAGPGSARACGGLLDLAGTLTMNNGGNAMTAPLAVGGSLNIGPSGALVLSSLIGGDLALGGDWFNNSGGTFTPNSRAVTFNGAGSQTISAAETFDYAIVDKPGGDVVLGSDVTVNQVLTLTSRPLKTGIHRLTIAPGGSVAGASGASYVVGNLRKRVNISGGAGSQTFEIGDLAVYAPVAFSTTNGLTMLDVTARTDANDHGQIGTSGLDASKTANRTWTLGVEAGQSVGPYDLTLDFAPSDLDGGADPLQFVMRRYSGGWSGTANPIRTATSTRATVPGAFGVFQVGEEVAPPDLSITDVTQAEGNVGTTDFTFDVALSPPSASTVTVDFQVNPGTATTANGDYVPASGTLTFLPGQVLKPIVVQVNGDLTREADETFTVELSNPTNAAILDGQGLGTITNDDPTPVLDIESVALVPEAAGIVEVLQVTLSHPSDTPVTVDYETHPGTATAGDDYGAVSGTLTFPAKDATPQFVIVPVVSDNLNEADESFEVRLVDPTGATLGNAVGTVTIQDDDPEPTIDIELVALSLESVSPVVLQVTLSHPSAFAVTVDYQTANGTATTANGDFVPAGGTLTFPPLDVGPQPVAVTLVDDATFEPDETFAVQLSNPSGGAIGNGAGTVTIQNDDPSPTLNIEPGAGAAEATGTIDVFVSLSNPSDQPVTVEYATVDGSATAANGDFVPVSGTLTFPPKDATPQQIFVTIVDDDVHEGDETFSVVLSDPAGATIGVAACPVTIYDDDATPALQIEAASFAAEGTGTIDVFVSLSHPSDEPVSVDYATVAGTATSANGDYLPVTGTLVFPPKDATPQAIVVTIVDDAVFEGDESFTIVLSNPAGATIGAGACTVLIFDDDPAPTIDIVPAVSTPEAGAVQLAVSLSNPSDDPVTVHYLAVDGSATVANGDYAPASGILTWPPKDASPQLVTITINADAVFEGDETFGVTLFSPIGALIGNGAATVTILDDDATPSLSIIDVTHPEGNVGTTAYTFSVLLSNPSADPVAVDYQTIDVSATGGTDYGIVSGTLLIPPKVGYGEIVVQVNGDLSTEFDEIFLVNLSDAVGATIADGQGVGTIVNDDPDVTAPLVTVVSPNGGEILIVGSTVKLAWTAEDDVGVTSVDLYVSRDHGATYDPIALGEFDDGTYDWTVTPPAGNVDATPVFDALLKVIAHDAASNAGEDASDAPFAIFDLATPTYLERFDGVVVAGGVELRWAFSDPSRLAEVTLDRGDGPHGPWTPVEATRRIDGPATVVVDAGVAPGRVYYYRLTAVERDGERLTFGPVVVETEAAAAVTPLAFAIGPNPTAGPVRMTYSLPRDSRVRLSVLDVQGREVALLESGSRGAGTHEARWSRAGERGRAAAGVYFLRLEVDGRTLMRRIALVD